MGCPLENISYVSIGTPPRLAAYFNCHFAGLPSPTTVLPLRTRSPTSHVRETHQRPQKISFVGRKKTFSTLSALIGLGVISNVSPTDAVRRTWIKLRLP